MANNLRFVRNVHALERPDPISAHRGVVAGQRLQGTWLHG